MKPKVLFVLESYLPNAAGGTERYVDQLIRLIDKACFEPEVLISSSDPKQSDYSYEGLRVQVFHVPCREKLKRLNGLKPPSGMADFKQKIKETEPDLVHFHSFGRAVNSFHLQWVKQQGIKTVFTSHLGGFFCVKGDFRLFDRGLCDGRVSVQRCMHCLLISRGLSAPKAKGLASVLARMPQPLYHLLPPQFHIVQNRLNEFERVRKYADSVIAIAPWIEKAFAINGMEKNLELVLQGIKDPGSREAPAKQPGNDMLKCLFVGRMNPSKGFHLLAEAAEQLDSRRFRLDIYTMQSGDEAYYHRYKAWANKRKNIGWFEQVPNAELMKRMPSYDLLILPSISNEMAPLVILEAYANKVPVLGSSYPAVADMIEHKRTGLHFESNNAMDLTRKLQQLSENPGPIAAWSMNTKKVRSFDELANDMETIYSALINEDSHTC